MLTTIKKEKMSNALKNYCKKYLGYTELDESGTRLMINAFLHEILGYTPLDEIKTEYMIKGTYADYMIQLDKTRHFLVEVKAFSLKLSDKHLRQTINYGANEGIEWALLTNGKCFELYKILFNKPIDSKLIFAIDLSDTTQQKKAVELLQFLHRDCVLKKGLQTLWDKSTALNPYNVAGILFAPQITSFIRKTINTKFDIKFTDQEINDSITKLIADKIDMSLVKPIRINKKIVKPNPVAAETAPIVLSKILSNPTSEQN